MIQRYGSSSTARNLRIWLPVMAACLTFISASYAQSSSGTATAGSGGGALPPAATIFVVPLQLQYQGFLTDDSGEPLNGPVEVIFQLFGSGPDAGKEIWTETHNLNADQGQIEVILGMEKPLTVTHLNRPGLELALSVGGVELSPRTPFTSVPYAILSADSERLAGQTTGQVVQQAVQRIAEPASAADIVLGFEAIGGQASDAQIPDSISRNADLQQQFYSRAEVDALVATLSQRIDQLQAQVDGQGGGGGDPPPDDELDARIDARVAAATELLGGALSRPKGGAVYFEGVDLYVVNGSGETDSANGTGNLFLGYNESSECIPRPPVTCPPPRLTTGSHNLVLGDRHSYSHWGSILAGGGNSAHAPYASVLGGNGNRAEGRNSVVLSGIRNVATADDSVVIGGFSNSSEAEYAVVVSGRENRASGDNSVVVGGLRNHSAELTQSAVVVGGRDNATTAAESVLVGGLEQTLFGSEQPVGGLGDISSTSLLSGALSREGDQVYLRGVNLHIENGMGQTNSSNGLGNLIVGYNESRAEGDARPGSHNVVLGVEHNYIHNAGLLVGQRHNLAGFGAAAIGGIGHRVAFERSVVIGGESNQTQGRASVIVGGRNNRAPGGFGVVVAGSDNAASDGLILGGFGNSGGGADAVVVGGQSNVAGGTTSVVVGGVRNTANGFNSTVVGGEGNTATAQKTTTVGGRNNTAAANHSTVTGGRNRRSGQ